MCLIKIEPSKITYTFQILFKLELKLLLFCRFPHVTKMCMIKIELSKITYSFHMLFKLGLKLLLFCCFPPMSSERLKDVPNQN